MKEESLTRALQNCEGAVACMLAPTVLVSALDCSNRAEWCGYCSKAVGCLGLLAQGFACDMMLDRSHGGMILC